MKKLLLPALFVALAIISSCKTETVTCTAGFLEASAVGFDPAKVAGARLVWYIANTNTAIDSVGVAPGGASADTATLTTLQSRFDYKLRFNDGTVYFINNITLSGIHQQTYKHSIMDQKLYGCIERVVSYSVNGQQYKVPEDKYDRVYIHP